jgi:integration host factor subunit beta
MTRSDLIDVLAVDQGISRSVSEEIVSTVFRYMTQSLVNGNKIEIRGFGSFQIREYDGYIARNPKTGVQLVVKPKKAPFFKTGKDLKERIQTFST